MFWMRNKANSFPIYTLFWRPEEKGYFNVLLRFQCVFAWNRIKCTRITITHVCFIALTLTGFRGLMFKQPPQDLTKVKAGAGL